MTRDEVTELLRKKIEKVGSVPKFSGKFDLSDPYIRNVLSGRTSPGPKICKILGIEPVDKSWRYVK